MKAFWLIAWLILYSAPLLFAADMKISAFPAATAVADGDELIANQGGTTRKITFGQGVATRIAGASGAAGFRETWQVLTANCAANATTTLTACMTTTGLEAGAWYYEYHIVWQSSITTTGVNFSVDATGTVTRHRMTRTGQTDTATDSNGIADQSITDVLGGVSTSWAGRTDNASLGPSAGVDTINVDQYDHIVGTLVTSTSGNLVLMHASETAASTQVMADTSLILKKLN